MAVNKKIISIVVMAVFVALAGTAVYANADSKYTKQIHNETSVKEEKSLTENEKRLKNGEILIRKKSESADKINGFTIYELTVPYNFKEREKGVLSFSDKKGNNFKAVYSEEMAVYILINKDGVPAGYITLSDITKMIK